MDRIVGKKSKTYGIIGIIMGFISFLICIGGIVVLIIEEGNVSLMFLIIGGIVLFLILTIVNFYTVIHYFKLPTDLIIVDDTSILLLQQNVEIRLSDVVKVVSYRPTVRGVTYNFGAIIITTKIKYEYNEYEQKYITNVDKIVELINQRLQNVIEQTKEELKLTID